MAEMFSSGRSSRLTPKTSNRVRLSELKKCSEVTANGSFNKVTDSSAAALELSVSVSS
jgi:hypothetical protein